MSQNCPERHHIEMARNEVFFEQWCYESQTLRKIFTEVRNVQTLTSLVRVVSSLE